MTTDAIAALRRKADRSLRAAERLLKAGDADFAISRAYYAMFYIAEALLLTKGLSFSKHAAVIGAIATHFVRPGLLPEQCHRQLRDAFRQRQEADYTTVLAMTNAEVEALLDAAREFITAATAIFSAATRT